VREIHDTNRKAPERVHNTKHESRGAGKETRGLEERRKRSGIRAKVSERPEGAETVGIRGKRGEKGDIIAAAALRSLCTTGSLTSEEATLAGSCAPVHWHNSLRIIVDFLFPSVEAAYLI